MIILLPPITLIILLTPITLIIIGYNTILIFLWSQPWACFKAFWLLLFVTPCQICCWVVWWCYLVTVSLKKNSDYDQKEFCQKDKMQAV